MMEQRSSVLYLEDGSSFAGHGFGAAKDVSGEVGMYVVLAAIKTVPELDVATQFSLFFLIQIH